MPLLLLETVKPSHREDLDDSESTLPLPLLSRRKFSSARSRTFSRGGFSILELIFVILVVTIMLTIAIPRIRVVTKERGVREAARIVASKLTNATQRATVDGTAGVVIRRNSNFVDDTLWYAATEIGTLRATPNYAGDQAFAKGVTPSLGAWKTIGSTVEIPMPFEFETQSPVNVGDSISFNHTRIQFEIEEIEAGQSSVDKWSRVLKLKVDQDSYPRLPPRLRDAPYVIHRQPKIVRSSFQQLPSQYIIDLRFSGYSGIKPVFEKEVTVDNTTFENYDIVILFNEFGRIEKLHYYEVNRSNERTGLLAVRKPEQSLHLLVTQSRISVNESPLADQLSLWVNGNTGVASVTYNDPQFQKLVSETSDSTVVQARGKIPAMD